MILVFWGVLFATLTPLTDALIFTPKEAAVPPIAPILQTFIFIVAHLRGQRTDDLFRTPSSNRSISFSASKLPLRRATHWKIPGTFE